MVDIEASISKLQSIVRQSEDCRRSKTHRLLLLVSLFAASFRVGSSPGLFCIIRDLIYWLFGKKQPFSGYLKEIDSWSIVQSEARELLGFFQREKLDSALVQAEAAGNRLICVLAPMYCKANLNDGFFQRVRSMDRCFGDNVLRLYISQGSAHEQGESFSYTFWDNNHIEIKYVNQDEVGTRHLKALIQKVGFVYQHSVYHTYQPVLDSKEVFLCLDLHGAVPEELKLMGKAEESDLRAEQEALAVQRAKAIICVSKEMERHMMRRYGYKDRFLIIPCADIKYPVVLQNPLPRPLENRLPVVVYAGGLQKWQLISRMQDAIESVGNQCAYHIFTPDTREFQKQWGKRVKPARMIIETRKHGDLHAEYQKCHYGFVLREDSVINRVSCPTKLAEYLCEGIVPILASPFIGDFIEMNMRYISLENFIKKKLPTEDERIQMVQDNYRVIQQLAETLRDGIDQLKQVLKEDK